MRKIQHILVICGPTSSGKTILALQLAKELLKANILSVDSRQVYQDLNIITGKDIPNNLSSKIKIFGLDLFKSDERANLADFVRYSQKIIIESYKSETPLIIVGGTGLYLKAITQNLSNVVIPPNQKLRQKIENFSTTKLQDLLKKENPQKYSSLNRSDVMNPRRLIRALEVSIYSRHTKSSISKINKKQLPVFHWVGLLTEKNTLKKQIRKRILKRISLGSINEVKKILKKFPDNSLSIYTSLGVSQTIAFLKGKQTKKEMIESWTNAEVDYARRQMVWFKKQPDIVWYDKDIDKTKLVQKLSKIYLENA